MWGRGGGGVDRKYLRKEYYAKGERSLNKVLSTSSNGSERLLTTKNKPMGLKMGRALVPFEQFQDSRGKNDTAVSKGVKRGKNKTAHRAFYFKKFRVMERDKAKE